MTDAHKKVFVSLVATVNILRRAEQIKVHPSKVVASDAMFRQMLADYDRAVELGKAASLAHETASRATITFTRAMGSYGQAYDPPGPHRAYTYQHQPNNQAAYRLGEVAALLPQGGDHIDYGLHLLKMLQEHGFGVFEIEPIKLHAPDDREGA